MTISSIEKEFDKKFLSPKTMWVQDENGKWYGKEDIKSFYRQKIEEKIKQENQDWIDGKRCHYCGRAKPYDALCDTCDDCLNNQ